MSKDISTEYTKERNKECGRKGYCSWKTDFATEIITHVTETQEAFIFQKISDFASSNYQIKIEKEELIQAISLIRMSREHGPGIDVRWETATQQCAVLDEAYMRGFRDGVNKEHARFMDILEGEKKDVGL